MWMYTCIPSGLDSEISHVMLQALETGTAGGNASSRLSTLSASLTQLVTDYVSQALFNADRLAFGMHLAHSLVPHLFQAAQWDLFLGNTVGMCQLKAASQCVPANCFGQAH